MGRGFLLFAAREKRVGGGNRRAGACSRRAGTCCTRLNCWADSEGTAVALGSNRKNVVLWAWTRVAGGGGHRALSDGHGESYP